MNVIYCTRGHYVGAYNMGGRNWHAIVTAMAAEERDDAPLGAKHCAVCGAKNLSVCEHCNNPMRPLTRHGGRPSYCVKCSKPFPWTQTALAEAKEYTDKLDMLTAEDKADLKESFADLTVDTARTPLAAKLLKQMMVKIGPVAGQVLSKIVVDFATKAAKKFIDQ